MYAQSLRKTVHVGRADRDAAQTQRRLQVGDVQLSEVEQRGRERGVGLSFQEDRCEILDAAGAAASDDRERNGVADGAGQRQVEAGLRAVAIDARQQDLAGTAPFGLCR